MDSNKETKSSLKTDAFKQSKEEQKETLAQETLNIIKNNDEIVIKPMNEEEKAKAISNFEKTTEINIYLFLFFALYLSFVALSIYTTFFIEEGFFLKVAVNGLFINSAIMMFFQIKSLIFLKQKKKIVFESKNYDIETVYPHYLDNLKRVRKDLRANALLFIASIFILVGNTVQYLQQ